MSEIEKSIVYYARQSSFGFSRNIVTLNYNPNSRNVGMFFFFKFE